MGCKKIKIYRRKLDDQAKIFSLSFNKKDTSIFRLSILLKEDIESKILQKALELTLKKYRAFKVKMKKGLFWYYLEANSKNPIISKENDYTFKKINTKHNNDYLFKVSYFEQKISIDFFHTLTDANGGEKFFKDLVYNYLALKYPEELNLTIINEKQIIHDSENSYLKNYKKTYQKNDKCTRGFSIKGKKLKAGKVGINQFNIKLDEIKKYAKSKDCSLSILLVAMIGYSIYETKYKFDKKNKPINICVPINLNNYFPSNTISNFVSHMIISLKLKHTKIYTFESILNIVKKEFEKKLKLEKIVATMCNNGKIINNPFIKIIPLYLKKAIVRLGALKFKKHFTITLSNMGKTDIDTKYSQYINNYSFILAPDWAEKIRCGACSYNDNLVITFGTNLEENCIEKKFRDLLNEIAINFDIVSNGINVITN